MPREIKTPQGKKVVLDAPAPVYFLGIIFCGALALLFAIGFIISLTSSPSTFNLPGIAYFFVFGILALFVFQLYYKDVKLAYHMNQVIKYGPYWNRHPEDFPIIGPEPFQESVKKILQELKQKAPHRYEEVIHYLPQARYNPNLTYKGREVLGLADGQFSIDGSGGWNNTYKSFLKTFLHEVGHCLDTQHNPEFGKDLEQDQKTADAYASTVFKELGYEPYQ